jgi:uncharacterized protein
MSTQPRQSPTFAITYKTEPSETLLAGFSAFGIAGLTAVDYIVDQLELEETGHVTAESLPSIIPFENGRPRHHSRLFSRSDLEMAVLVNELFLPVWAADSFADAVLSWTGGTNVNEIGVLSGVPVAHGPDDHRTFHVATDDYREHRLTDVDVPPMGNGFLDGVNASLMARGLDSDLRVGVFVTPVHAQVPDAEAAMRLVDATERVYGLGLETATLEAFAAEVEQHYAELAERLEATEQEARPEERMYM